MYGLVVRAPKAAQTVAIPLFHAYDQTILPRDSEINPQGVQVDIGTQPGSHRSTQIHSSRS
jgi:hypothetical protein